MSAPVKHTCPDIDQVIKKVKAALSITKAAMKRHEKMSDDWDDYDSIESELMFVEGELEDLRADNVSLREWGEELEQEKESTDEYIAELEDKIASLLISSLPPG